MRFRTLLNVVNEEPPTTTLPTSPPSTQGDPEEVDLSTHTSASRGPITNNGTAPTEADIRALLRGGAPPPGVGGQQQQGGEEDPLTKILQQVMGGGGMPGAEGQGREGEGGLPPGLAAMMGAGGMGMPGMGGAPTTEHEDTYAYLWKIVHAVLALILGIYVTATSRAFNGHFSRGGIAGTGHEGGVNVFWLFATAELVLQGSRFFLEKGTGSQLGGWMGIAGSMLPEPWKGYVRLAARYSGVWSTVVEDGMVVVFVLGCVAWWKGAAG